jgi:pilus assembly protein CpaB
MNRQRVLVLAGAFVASILVAFLVSHMLGGGTPKAQAVAPPPRIAMSDVLVAATDLSPGTELTSAMVRWQQWPKSALDPRFITKDTNPDIDRVVDGAVVRAPLVPGEPVTNAKVVQHAQGAGFMAAIVTPGMRAVSIPITTDTGAGGFILPNDRVDVISTLMISESPRRFKSSVLFTNIRVLAVDQTYENKDQKTVLAKTATLELTPEQGRLASAASQSGTISLALRSLDDSHETDSQVQARAAVDGDVNVIRYGLQGPKVFGGSH